MATEQESDDKGKDRADNSDLTHRPSILQRHHSSHSLARSRSGSIGGRPRLGSGEVAGSTSSVHDGPVQGTKSTHFANEEYAKRALKRVKRLVGEGHNRSRSLPALPPWLGGGGTKAVGRTRRSGSVKSHRYTTSDATTATSTHGRASSGDWESNEEPDLRHRFRGHRSKSFTTEYDPGLTVEIRARQRTFEGAYWRTALGALSYALVVLKIFTRRFYNIGLILVILSSLLIVVAIVRRRRSDQDFADDFWHVREEDQTAGRTHIGIEDHPELERPTTSRSRSRDGQSRPALGTPRFSFQSLFEAERGQDGSNQANDHIIQTKGQTGRLWGRQFRTSGLVVVMAALTVGVAEILVIIFIVLLP